MVASLITPLTDVYLDRIHYMPAQWGKLMLRKLGCETNGGRRHFFFSVRNPACENRRGSMIPVCVFAKPPECGNVKTRLIGELGERGASTLAGAMFQDVWAVVSACPGLRPVLATTVAGAFPVTIEPENVWLQGEGDLGTRLEKILRQALDSVGAVIAIGADSPTLASSHLRAATEALEQYDAVIGRSLDGGFYLLGVRHSEEGWLGGLPWSTCQTAEATISRLKERGRTIHELPPLFDVDVPEDLKLLTEYLRSNPEAAPHTRAWAKENGRLSGRD